MKDAVPLEPCCESTFGVRRLARDQVELWSFPLNVAESLSGRLAGLLEVSERKRVQKYRFEREQRRFAVGRAVSRLLLSLYVGVPPQSIRFDYTAQGKPSMRDHDLSFNLSHSDELAIVAVGWSPLGVDVEQVRPVRDLELIVQRFFSSAECQMIGKMPGAGKERAFFNCWTRKEALLKAIGEGLLGRLNGFDVSVSPEEPARLIETRISGLDEFALFHLEPGPDFIGALAASRKIEKVSGWALSQTQIERLAANHV